MLHVHWGCDWLLPQGTTKKTNVGFAKEMAALASAALTRMPATMIQTQRWVNAFVHAFFRIDERTCCAVFFQSREIN